MRAVPIVLLMAALSACQSRAPMPWQHTGKTAEEVKADEADCARRAARATETPDSAVASADTVANCMEGKGYHRDRWNRFACCRRLLGS